MAKKSFKSNLQFVREPDFIEYFIFSQLPQSEKSSDGATDGDATDIEQQLFVVRNKCLQLVEHLVKERKYIWHKDEFNLLVRSNTKKQQLLDEETVQSNRTTAAGMAVRGHPDENDDILPPHLHGVTHYGENIADEWFIVFLLCELTKMLPNSVARIVDSDGEFLLIEAAEVVPNWVNPDTCEQRVYLSNGFMHLVQNSPSNTSKLMSVSSAVRKIQINPTLYKVSENIQKCIDARLQQFQIGNNVSLHKQIVNVPIKVAMLLQSRPSLIAPAVRAFCEHDGRDERLFRKMENGDFSPSDRIRINVDFTRCLYAMLMHNNYQPDRKQWGLINTSNVEQYKENLLGSKLAFGFTILLESAKKNLDNGAWLAYLHNLHSNGYFDNNLEGSAEYNRLYKEAKEYYQMNRNQFRTNTVVGEEILEMMKNSIDQHLQLDDENHDLQASDPDDWLNVRPEQLDEMLGQRYGFRNFHKCDDKYDAKQFTNDINDFLNKESNFEGIEKSSDIEDIDSYSDDNDFCNEDDVEVDDDNDDDDDDDDDAYKDDITVAHYIGDDVKQKKKKSRLEQQLYSKDPLDWLYPQKLKLVQVQGKRLEEQQQMEKMNRDMRRLERLAKVELKLDSNSDLSDNDDADPIERNPMKSSAASVRQYRNDFKAYLKKMDEELANTTIGKTFITQNPETKTTSGVKDVSSSSSASSPTSHKDDEFDDIEDFQAIDINVNTLENMMQSYNSQMGASGPVSNLIGAMSLAIKKPNSTTPTNYKTVAKDLIESTV